MIRSLLFLIIFLFLYHAIKTVFRSARKAYHEEEPRTRIMGEEMVFDPQCRTYVVKDRAVKRVIRGSLHSFCSEVCARQYEENNRS